MEHREETVSEILLDRNQAKLVTHPHTTTLSNTHTHKYTQNLCKANKRESRKTRRKAASKGMIFAENHQASLLTLNLL